MNFFLIWDKQKEAYVTTRNSLGTRTANARIYATYNHAAVAAMLLVLPHWSATAEERRKARKERYEIHRYTAQGFDVVG